MTEQEEAQLISNSLNEIAEGIILSDWQNVCNGYNKITGKNLEVPFVPEPPKKSKLEMIREMIKEPKSSDQNPQNNEEPVAKPKKTRKPKVKVEEPVEEDIVKNPSPSDSEEIPDIVEIKSGNRVIISTPFNEKEAKRNEQLAKRKLTIGNIGREGWAHKKPGVLKEDAEIRYSDNPPPPQYRPH